MAFSLLANTLAQSTNGNGITSSAINTTGVNLIIVSVIDYSVNPAITLSDNQGNTWTELSIYTGSSARSKIYYCYNPTTNSNHTFTATGNASYVSFSVLAFSGAAVNPLDKSSGNGTSSSVTSLSTNPVTPAEDNELIFTGIGFANADVPISLSINNSFTIVNQGVNVSGQAFGIGTAYLIQSAASAINPSWSWSGSSPATTSIATFKALSVTFLPQMIIT